jgi:hypothetical protein
MSDHIAHPSIGHPLESRAWQKHENKRSRRDKTTQNHHRIRGILLRQNPDRRGQHEDQHSVDSIKSTDSFHRAKLFDRK